MRTLKMMKTLGKTTFALLVLCFVYGNITPGFSATARSARASIDEDIIVYTSAITGVNTVQVIFSRTGPDAGLNEVWVTYTVRFNSGSSSESVETFSQFLSFGQTYYVDYVAGPVPTGDAEVIDVQWHY